MLNDLNRMNEIFVRAEGDLNIIFGLLQQESRGNLSIYQIKPPRQRGTDDMEIQFSKIAFH